MKNIILCIAWVFCTVVTNAQNTGIGTTTPLARLHVTDSNVVFTGPPTIDFTTPFPPPIQGPGSRMMWYPQKAAFRAGIVDGAQWDKDNIGRYSFAVGFGTMASGDEAFASGSRSTASGVVSTAMGRSTASGNWSTAAGLSLAAGAFAFAGGNSYALASFSTAFGEDNYARAYGAVALGVRNDNSDEPNPDAPHPADRLFQIGNGNFSTRRNALTVLRNGNMGVGTTSPVARLHVADSSVVFTGPPNLPFNTPFPPPIQGPGTRMMWYPQKGAWRAGFVNGTQWDKDNIGKYSFAVGFNSTAIGEAAFAAGGSTANDSYSTAMGNSIASGSSSTAAGLSTASGAYAFAGGNSYALAPASTAFGHQNYAKAFGGVALGDYNDISDNPDPNVVSATDRLFQIGNGFVTRSNALTVLRNGNMGIGNVDPPYPLSFPNSVGDKISLYGEAGPHYGFGIQGSLLQIHAALQSNDVAIGYGSSATFTENFRVKGNGNVSLGMSTADATLTFGQSLSKKIILFRGGSGGEAGFGVFPNELRIQSDYSGAAVTFGYDNAGTSFVENMRIQGNGNLQVRGAVFANSAFYTSDVSFKKNINPINGSLEKILLLNAYHYNWKDEANDPYLQTGVLAQEVQKIFPELVRENNRGYLSVNYIGLIPYLIESIKELKKENEELRKMKEELEELKKRMDKLSGK